MISSSFRRPGGVNDQRTQGDLLVQSSRSEVVNTPFFVLSLLTQDDVRLAWLRRSSIPRASSGSVRVVTETDKES